MAKKKVQIKAERHGGSKYFVIDGQPYVADFDRRKTHTLTKMLTIDLKPVNRKKYEKEVNELVESLASKIDVKEWLRQCLYDTPLTDLILAKKELKKKKPKVRSTKGCLFLKVGEAKIGIRD